MPEKPPVASRVVTLKVHYINLSQQGGPWSVADWDRRNAAMDVAYKAIAPDVMAFQEMASLADRDDGSVNLARDFLLSQNPDYSAAVVED